MEQAIFSLFFRIKIMYGNYSAKGRVVTMYAPVKTARYWSLCKP